MKAVISSLAAVCVATIAALVFGCGGGLTPMLARISLELGLIAGGVAWGSLRAVPKASPVRGWAAWSVMVAFALFALRAFCWLIFQRVQTMRIT